MRTALLAIALMSAALLAAPAEAASRSTARASADLPVRAGPGIRYETIGTLEQGAEVRLVRCTRDSNWCLFIADDGEPGGWVRGSYLVGSGAKLEVTPHRFLEFNPLNPLDRCHDGDDDSLFCR
ncbi:MAG: hypothetical protein JWQ89_38 [Devosia sp.]|uniref:SH3 domain-containing protein n=1 Tax=Devosia sp. TaxID=1871048 RepID=UPI00262815B2|nr:SH3 domain-containing protein [Devosia sp.]MDB5538311.1 hypothetical protein [Devosia sp.]